MRASRALYPSFDTKPSEVVAMTSGTRCTLRMYLTRASLAYRASVRLTLGPHASAFAVLISKSWLVSSMAMSGGSVASASYVRPLKCPLLALTESVWFLATC